MSGKATGGSTVKTGGSSGSVGDSKSGKATGGSSAASWGHDDDCYDDDGYDDDGYDDDDDDGWRP